MDSDRRFLDFSRALADSVRSGLPLAETLRSLSGRHGRRLRDAAELVAQGRPLHESLAAQALFPPLLLALVRAGEESGKLDSFLERYAGWLETRIDFRRRLRRAALYPAFCLALAAALFLLFSGKLAPELFAPLLDAGLPIPDGARRVMDVGASLLARWPLLLTGLAGAAGAVCLLSRTAPARALGALSGHWLPGARYVSEEARIFQLVSTLQLLLGAGLRPRQILDILREQHREDLVLGRRLARAAESLARGESFSRSLADCLPPEDRPRLAVAEAAGRLDAACGELAREHRERHSHRLKVAAKVLKLASLAGLAPLCFGLLLWLLWPTFALLGGDALAGAAAGPETDAGLYRAPSAPSASPAGFNETRAKEVVDFMRAHAPKKEAPPKEVAPASTPAAEAPAPATAAPAKKKEYPKLQSKPMPRPTFKKIEPTSIRSSLEP